MHPKTIIFLDQYPGLSGGQRVLLRIASRCSQRGNRCIAVLPAKGRLSKELEEAGIKVEFMPIGYYSITSKSASDMLSYLARMPVLTILLWRLIRRESAQLVYANGARTIPWGTLACRLTATPMLWHIHSIFSGFQIRKTLGFFGRFKEVRKIFFVSKEASRALSSLATKAQVIYNAVEIPAAQGKNDILRKEFNLPPEAFLVGCVGMIEAWKNQQDIIEAADIIRGRGVKNAYFFIIGEPLYKKGAGRYKNHLEGLTKKLGLEKEVIFAGQRDNVTELMQGMDLLVICSKDPDPCPLVSLEAASAGLPVISSDRGGVKEMFEGEREALFYRPTDTASLASLIIRCMQNKDELLRLSSAIRRKAEEKFGMNEYLDKICEEIEA